MKLPGIFNNKILCYAMLFLAVMNVVGYITTAAYECLIVFGLAYYIGHCYLKNQTAAILVGLFSSNFIFGCGRVKETFVEANKSDKDKLSEIAEKASKAAASAMEKVKEGMKKAELTEEQCTTGGGTWDKANKKCKQAFESFKEAAETAAATADQAAEAAEAAAAAEEDEEEANDATSEAVAKEGFRNYW